MTVTAWAGLCPVMTAGLGWAGLYADWSWRLSSWPHKSNPLFLQYVKITEKLSSRYLLPTREYLSVPPPSLLTAHCCVHHTECCFFDSLLIASANLDGEKQQNIFHRPSILPLRTMECNSIMNYCVSLQPGAGRGRGRGTAVTASHTLTAVISRISTP